MKAANYIPKLLGMIGSGIVGYGIPLFGTKPIMAVVMIWAGVGICIWGWTQSSRVEGKVTVQTSKLRKHPADRREVLILFLSTGDLKLLPVDLTGDLTADLAALAAKKKQEADLGQRSTYWSWEQPMRAIQHHLKDDGPLRRLVILGSAESVTMIKEFVDLLGRYPAFRGESPKVNIQTFAANTNPQRLVPSGSHSKENGIDFEDFDKLSEALERVLEILKTVQNIPGKDIQIDFTGGQKPTSVVAAAVTLFSNVSNQYVATNPHERSAPVWEYDVWGYDLQQHTLPSD